nr:hypothetical protein [Oscillospiraceae bacterium]
MENYIEDNRIHDGHRGRMRAKLIAHGQRIFDTYELLEMLLYQTIPYKDTNPVSKRLLMAFGSLEGVLTADRDALTNVNGVGERTADFLTEVGKLGDIIGAEILSDGGEDLTSYDAVGKYLVSYFSGMQERQVIALFLDSSMRLLCMKKLYDLDYDSGGVKAKPFIDEAVLSRAAVVISAHNHPFGPFYPTQGDRASNNAITDALMMAGFVHAEHYIISGECYAGIGSLKNFGIRASQMPALDGFIESKGLFCDQPRRVSSLSQTNCLGGSEIGEASGCNLKDLDYFKHLLDYAVGSSADEAARLLLPKYRTIENILTASARELTAIVGERCAFYLKLLAYVTSRRRTDSFAFGRSHTAADTAEYLKALFLGESVEKTYLLTYGESGKITGCHLLGEGTVSSSEILPRKAVETAISESAASVALAHNHPFGTTKPSADDVNLTKAFATLFKNCEITLTDHYIVAGQLCDTVRFESETERDFED